MFKHNLKACLNTQRTDNKGRYPLRIRSTIQRKVSYYSTGIMLKVDEWDGREVVKHPNKILLNTAIRTKINDLEKTFLEQSLSGEDVKRVKKIISHTFSEYAAKKIQDVAGVQGTDTIRIKKSYLAKFNKFNSHIKLKDVTSDVLVKYENFCRAKGNSNNTIVVNTKFIKSIINAAVNERVLDKNPLIGFKGSKFIAPFRNTLTEAEIKKFEDFADNKKNNERLLNVCNWFLFSVYTGLRYGDTARFKGFVNGRVLLQTEKTNEVVSIYATPKIIEARARLTREIISNQSCNEFLKELAEVLKIDKHITFHTSRHTFAVRYLQLGGRLEILQKLLGHSAISTTSIYGKISNLVVDEELKRIWG